MPDDSITQREWDLLVGQLNNLASLVSEQQRTLNAISDKLTKTLARDDLRNSELNEAAKTAKDSLALGQRNREEIIELQSFKLLASEAATLARALDKDVAQLKQAEKASSKDMDTWKATLLKVLGALALVGLGFGSGLTIPGVG